MQSNGSKQINTLSKSEANARWKWNKNQKESNGIFPANPFNQKKTEAEVILGPGVGAGIGCGVGFGAGLVGGIGYAGWPWNQMQLVFGFGVGCGIGLGFGYGQGIGYASSMDSIANYLTEEGSDLVQT